MRLRQQTAPNCGALGEIDGQDVLLEVSDTGKKSQVIRLTNFRPIRHDKATGLAWAYRSVDHLEESWRRSGLPQREGIWCDFPPTDASQRLIGTMTRSNDADVPIV